MQDVSYSTVLTTIQGLSGVDSFSTTEATQVLAFVNRRAYQAYRASDMWARYVKIAQARPAQNSIIPFTYSEAGGARNITAATRSGNTVTVTVDADVGYDFVTGQRVAIAGLSGTADPNGTFRVTVSGDAEFQYSLADTTLTGTETYTGSGTSVPEAMSDIDTFIKVYDYDRITVSNGSEYEFYVESDGCHIINNASAYKGFYTTYKKVWDGPYTTASTTIPREFQEYIAHAAYADFLRLSMQTGRALAEEQAAQQYLLIELERPQNQATGQLLSTFRTHATEQRR